MTIIEITNLFNLIKPTIKEIKDLDSTLTYEVAEEIFKEYNLQIISSDIYDSLILDFLKNTNIKKLYFSQFNFIKPIDNGNEFEIGFITEKGELFYDNKLRLIKLKNADQKNNQIDELNFLIFLIKYWELDFRKIFKREKSSSHTKSIEFDPNVLKKFTVFEILLDEIEATISDL